MKRIEAVSEMNVAKNLYDFTSLVAQTAVSTVWPETSPTETKSTETKSRNSLAASVIARPMTSFDLKSRLTPS